MRSFFVSPWLVFGPLAFLCVGLFVLWATGNLKVPDRSEGAARRSQLARIEAFRETTSTIAMIIVTVLGVVLVVAAVWMVLSFITSLPGGSTG
jgi:hypothetical protein